MMWGWGGNGFGNNGGGLANQLNNDYGRDMLLQAINGNGNAISNLATTLNCDINAVQGAVNAVSAKLQDVGCQVGMSGQQVINAIQAGNASIASQMASCCCDVRESITKQGYENQLATLNQTNILGSKIDSQTALINDKFCQLEMREMQNKIDSQAEVITQLRNNENNAAQTAQIAQMIAPLQAQINAIAAKQPQTVPVQWPQLTAVNTTPSVGNGFGWGGWWGNGFGNGNVVF